MPFVVKLRCRNRDGVRGGDGPLPELVRRPLGLLLAISIPAAMGTGAAATASSAAVAAAAVRHASACCYVVVLLCLSVSPKVEAGVRLVRRGRVE